MAELNWSDAQWQKVKDAITEAFGKASVASAFLPCYGPLPGSTETVRNERLKQTLSKPLRLDADHGAVNLKLVNLTVNVELSSEQVADETLSNAMLLFRRAANILAQETDRIVFKGHDRGDPSSLYVANKIQPQKGLADFPARLEFPTLTGSTKSSGSTGGDVVLAVVTAIQVLENSSNPEPFACVLGNTLFKEVHTPTQSMVLPADRITPLLKGGPLLRSGKMDDDAGIVVSLAANAVDIVVGTPPTVQFLQRGDTAKFLFRVYQRFVLRIRDKANPPVAGFAIPASAAKRLELAKVWAEVARKAAEDLDLKRDLARAEMTLAQLQVDAGQA